MAAEDKPPDTASLLEKVAKRAQEALIGDFRQAKDSLDISQRLRAAEEQKMTLARGEIQRQEFIIGELRQGIDERRQEGKDAGDLEAHLEHAKSRLEEAHDDLKRAEETRTNIGISMEGMAQRHQVLAAELTGLGVKVPAIAAAQNKEAGPEQAPAKMSVRDALRGIGTARAQSQSHPAPRVK